MASSEPPSSETGKGSTNPDIQALMNLSESIGDQSSEAKSPWNFSQAQPIFKQPMYNPPPVQRMVESSGPAAEHEFRVPTIPPYRGNVVQPDMSPGPSTTSVMPGIKPDQLSLRTEPSDVTRKPDEEKVSMTPDIPSQPSQSGTDAAPAQVEEQPIKDDAKESEDQIKPNSETIIEKTSESASLCSAEDSVDSFVPSVSFTVGDEDTRKSSDTKDSGDTREREPTVDEEEIRLASKVYEYQWPNERGGEWCLLQEQVSEYLNVLSFKRKHPDLHRRAVEYKERIFLRERGVVTETQCDLGLTVLRTEEVVDLICAEYPQKYSAFAKIMHEREKKRMIEQRKIYEQEQAIVEKNKLKLLVKKAIKSAADYNAQFMRELKEERRAYFDLQTQEVHYPQGKMKKLPPEKTDPGAYPLALIPGQYQNHYHKYTPQEMKYLPINTALYSPPRALQSIYADPDTQTEGSDGEERLDRDTEASSSSGSDSDSGSDESQDEQDGPEAMETEETAEEEEVVPVVVTPSRRGRGRGSWRGRGRGRGRGAARARRRRPHAPVVRADPLCEGEARREGSPPEDGLVVDLAASLPRGSNSLRGRPVSIASLGSFGVERENAVQCSICHVAEEKGEDGDYEALVQCSQCKSYGHPNCLELTDEMVPIIKTYAWQCMECKICAKCTDAQDEDKMMFCDHCDRGFHTFCVGLRSIPTGRWECPGCRTEEQPPKKRGRVRLN